MINRAGNKEKAKRVLNENGNLSGMVGMEILYRVIAAITSVLLGAMIAGGIGVVSAIVSAPFKLFGLAGIIIAYVLITPIATLVGAIAGGAVAGPFEVARYRYYLSLRKNGIRPKVTCIFDAFDFFMQFALVTGVRMLTIMWIVRGEKISRIHCTVQYNGKDLGFNVTDHSRNGVFVNGVRIPYNVPTYVSGKSIVALADGANKFQLIEAADEDDRSPALGADNPKRLSSPMVLSFPRKTVYILTPMVIPTQCLVAATGALPVSVTSSMESAICSLHSICKF